MRAWLDCDDDEQVSKDPAFAEGKSNLATKQGSAKGSTGAIKIAQPVDLTWWLDDPYLEPEQPTVGAIEGGGALFYRGKLNEIHAAPGIGKTNINLAVALDVMRTGGHVVYIDPEDNPRSIVTRLQLFGGSSEQIRRFFHYFEVQGPETLEGIIAFANECDPDLVVIDGLAEMIALRGLNEDRALDVLETLHKTAIPLSKCGAAVVISDHITKNSEGHGRYARGSGAKLGRYDGAVYEVKLVEEYGPNQKGVLALTVAKDRNGGAGPVQTTVAEVWFTPGEVGTQVTIRSPKDKQKDDKQLKLRSMMSKVFAAIEGNPRLNKTALRKAIGGKAKTVDNALAQLITGGYVQDKSTGRESQFEVTRSYPDEPCPTVSQPCP
jgi:hypothetical protein